MAREGTLVAREGGIGGGTRGGHREQDILQCVFS